MITHITTLLKLVLALLILCNQQSKAQIWKTIWEDNFNLDHLDLLKWTNEVYCGGLHGELQCNTANDNFIIAAGRLVLEAKKFVTSSGTVDGCTHTDSSFCNVQSPFNYTSARIRNMCSPLGSRRYGRWNIRALLPSNPSLRVTFWLANTDGSYGEGDVSGGIALMQFYSSTPNALNPFLLHSRNGDHMGTGPKFFPGTDFASSFNTFSVEWDPDQIRWLLNDQLYYSEDLDRDFFSGVVPQLNPYQRSRSPFDKPFHIVIALDVLEDSPMDPGSSQLIIESVQISTSIPSMTLPRIDTAMSQPVPLNDTRWTLMWNEEFDEALNQTLWEPVEDCSGRTDLSAQCYTARDQNVRVQNGILVLQARPEEFNGTLTDCVLRPLGNQACQVTRSFTSGQIRSIPAGGASWKYGMFEISAKLPYGQNLKPSIRLEAVRERFGSWPASGEINIMEGIGDRPDTIQGSLHHGGVYPLQRTLQSEPLSFPMNFSDSFHHFGLEWNAESISWFVDGNLYWRQLLDRSFFGGCGRNLYTKNGDPFMDEFMLVLDLEVERNVDELSEEVIIARDDLVWASPTFEIDYVRVYRSQYS